MVGVVRRSVGRQDIGVLGRKSQFDHMACRFTARAQVQAQQRRSDMAVHRRGAQPEQLADLLAAQACCD
jgi:hypothetical protein